MWPSVATSLRQAEPMEHGISASATRSPINDSMAARAHGGESHNHEVPLSHSLCELMSVMQADDPDTVVCQTRWLLRGSPRLGERGRRHGSHPCRWPAAG